MPVRPLLCMGDRDTHCSLVQAYHSSFNGVESAKLIGSIPVLPVRTQFKGIAPRQSTSVAAASDTLPFFLPNPHRSSCD
jgi:hypothetical protein